MPRMLYIFERSFVNAYAHVRSYATGATDCMRFIRGNQKKRSETFNWIREFMLSSMLFIT